MSPVHHQTLLAHKLSRYALGVGTLVVGNALPQKADADLIHQTFTGVADSALSLQFYTNAELRTATGFGDPAFVFFQATYGIGMSHAGGAFGYTYQPLVLNTGGNNYLAPLITTPRTDIDLANLNSMYTWNPGGFARIEGAQVGVPVFAGLRKITPGGTYYGWAEVELGSIRINQAAFNRTAGDSITLGQTAIPEPSTLGLLVGGAAGLAALRNRRKKAAAAKA